MERGSTGPARDRVYSIEEDRIAVRHLRIRPDPKDAGRHAFVEPSQPVLLDSYEREIASTRPEWRQAWPT